MKAEEFLKKEYACNSNEEYISIYIPLQVVEQEMIVFAKYHVEQALFHASHKAQISVDLRDFIEDSWGTGDLIDKQSIVTSYPLENIK